MTNGCFPLSDSDYLCFMLLVCCMRFAGVCFSRTEGFYQLFLSGRICFFFSIGSSAFDDRRKSSSLLLLIIYPCLLPHQGLKYHQAKGHGDGKPLRSYQCSRCGRAFETEQLQRIHENQHDDQAPTCERCGRQFARLASLVRHISMCKGEEYICVLCFQIYIIGAC